MVQVSIIVPIFNTENYLKECLNSIKEQTLKDIEIICVNDGSTDGSEEIIKSFCKSDPRFKLINQKNKGQSTARNRGIKEAKGEFIAFADSDDKIETNMLEILLQNAKKNEAEISMCSINTFNENEIKKDSYLNLDILPNELEDKSFQAKDTRGILFKIPVVPWNKIYKTSFLKENNIYFEEGINFEDNLFFTKTFFLAKNIVFTKLPLYNYRENSQTSYSKKGRKDHKKLDFFTLYKLQKKFLKENGFYKDYKKGFEYSKKQELFYWFNKIENKNVRIIYFTKLILQFSFETMKKFCPIYNFIQTKKRQKNLLSLLKDKKVIFRGANKDLESVLAHKKLQNNPNILGIIDKNSNKIGEKLFNYKITNYDILNSQNPDIIVLSTNSIFNFDKIVAKELKEINKNIQLETTIFDIQKD